MPSRSFALLALTITGLLVACSGPSTTAGARSATPAQITTVKGLFPALEKDMSTDVIRQKLGPPAEIQPMASPEGKAEVWVYHFEKSVGMTQVATGTRDVPAMGLGMAGPVTTTVQEQTYSMAETRSMVTLSLLMFNGRLAAQKAKVENRVDYN